MADNVKWIVRNTESEVREIVADLQKEGWEIYYESVPLSGQEGFYCVKTEFTADGESTRTVKNVVWNMYSQELHPVTIDARGVEDMLSFIWQHGSHEGFGYFEWSNEQDIGFVCHCQHHNGRSLALKIGPEAQEKLNEAAWDLLLQYHEELGDLGRD